MQIITCQTSSLSEAVPEVKTHHIVIDGLLDGDDKRFRWVEDIGHQTAVGLCVQGTTESSLQLEPELAIFSGEEPTMSYVYVYTYRKGYWTHRKRKLTL